MGRIGIRVPEQSTVDVGRPLHDIEAGLLDLLREQEIPQRKEKQEVFEELAASEDLLAVVL